MVYRNNVRRYTPMSPALAEPGPQGYAQQGYAQGSQVTPTGAGNTRKLTPYALYAIRYTPTLPDLRRTPQFFAFVCISSAFVFPSLVYRLGLWWQILESVRDTVYCATNLALSCY
jgi:hypothetical protein